MQVICLILFPKESAIISIHNRFASGPYWRITQSKTVPFVGAHSNRLDTLMSRYTSQRDQNINERRQIRTIRERQRRNSMTEEQRQIYLSRRRSTYQRQRSELNIQTNGNSPDTNNSTDLSNQQELLHRRRLYDRNRRQAMTVEERLYHLAQRRENYRRRRNRQLHTTNLETMEISNENLVAENNMIPEQLSNDDQSGITVNTVRQTCCLQTLPYPIFSSNFHTGDNSIRQSTHNDRRGHGLNNTNNLAHEETNDIRKYRQSEQGLNIRHIRLQIISPGWKITMGMNTHDFGRLILRVVKKLKKHVNKRIAWIEGWDLSERGILARRNMEESTLFKNTKKVRFENDADVQVFYNYYKQGRDDIHVTS